jgi:hypothetical protein
MIGEEDNAILIDFGTSKQYDEESGENTSTLLGKTPGYAPPEQMANVVMKFTEATDIYALGATMYKMLTGITPPDSSLRSSGIVELESLPPEVDKDISAAIYKSLSLNKQHRPQSIDVFLEMLGDTSASDNNYYSHNSTFSHSSNSTANEETVIEASKIKNEINGREYVDLGLPSGIKWATCNVGASSPEKYGKYYLWGETTTKTKYKRYGKDFSDIKGDTRYDAARANWGGSWRLPTKAELEELKDNCTWSWTTQGGKNGYKVTGPNGNSIFLPAAGYYDNRTALCFTGDYGHYWSSTPSESDAGEAFDLQFNSRYQYKGWGYRFYGQSVRPVSE